MGEERERNNTFHYKLIRGGELTMIHLLGLQITEDSGERSFQDALRAFFKPIKNDDPRLDFYTTYKKEATDYDTDYLKKYDEDLNITLIFVCLSFTTPDTPISPSVRGLVYFLLSVQPSSSTFNQTSHRTPMSSLQFFSVLFSSPSTSPPFQAKTPPSRLPRGPPPARSS